LPTAVSVKYREWIKCIGIGLKFNVVVNWDLLYTYLFCYTIYNSQRSPRKNLIKITVEPIYINSPFANMFWLHETT